MNIFSFIKEHISILDVIQTYTTLKKAGLYWKGHCPFHHEKTASFTVSPHKGIFYCFGCQEHGDVISFITKVEHYSVLEAAYFLADRYKLTLPETITKNQSSQDNNRYYEICEHIARWCHMQLYETPSVLSYLNKRNITKTGITHFLLGYLPGSNQTLKSFLYDMKQQSILMDDLLDMHFLSKGKSTLYTPFEDRIIFPIKDHLGRFCGFGGRIFKPNDTRVKYYNSSETHYFNKGKLLFGLDQAKKEIQKTGTAFLVEGYTDCIAMVESGYFNTVATLGTACTITHLEQINRYAQKLIVIYDADSAGKQALLRLAELCWQVALELKVIQLPPGEDPASFLIAHSLKPCIASAQDIFDFFIETTSNRFSDKSLSEKLHTARKIIEVINTIEDPLKRNILLRTASNKLEIPFDSIKKEPAKRHKKNYVSSLKSKNEPLHRKHTATIEKLSKKIFVAIIQDRSLLETYHPDYVCPLLFEPLGSLLKALKELQDQHGSSVSFTHFFDTLSIADQKIVSRVILEMNKDTSPETVETLIDKLYKEQWKINVQNIKNKLQRAQEEDNQQEVGALLQELLLLKKKMAGKNHLIIG